MSKLIQIENALKAVDQATFQTLCDDYLHHLGYESINRIGSVIGKRKTAKGTPDTYIILPNGKYVFAEHTSKGKGLFKKLSGDLSKCFDEKKTGIPVADIQEIILCHNGKLQPAETKALILACQSQGCRLKIIGLDRLALDLNRKYQILAHDYLGIEPDTGQILLVGDFIKEYEKSELTTPLSTKFHFREEEIKVAQNALRDNDLLIVTGRPGVGKSRFAVECGRLFTRKHRSYKFYCILNKDAPLSLDLKAYFAPTHNYIILVDDADRISEINHTLRLLNGSGPGHKVKIIITVRDYALRKIQELAKPYPKQAGLSLENFDQKQLNELLKDEYGILDYYYLERIWRISQGNSRLAVMAAEIVKRKQTLGSIADVSALYDEYFGTIAKDLSDLKNADLLKAAGVISLFRFIDRTQEDMFNKIVESFGLQSSVLWDNVLRLHDMEMVDLYEKEIARISDQVLRTYLLYKAFIKDQVLDFAVILNKFFGNEAYALSEYRLKDAIYPVLDAFSHRFVSERIHRHVDHKWSLLRNDEENLLRLMDVFWFLKETHTLFYLKERIDAVVPQPTSIHDLSFVPDSNETKDRYLRILRFFDQTSTDNFGIALEIILAYLEKLPSLTPQVLRLLTHNFAFDRDSHFRSYSIQRALVTKLIERSKGGVHGEFYYRVMLPVAKQYLNMHFRSDWAESRGSRLVSISFFLLPTPEIFELRMELWQFLIGVYSEGLFRPEILEIISAYSNNRPGMTVAKIAEEDSKLLLPFMETSFDPCLLLHCRIVHDYLQFLDRHSISYKKRLKRKFRNEAYKVAQVLKDDKKRAALGWQQYHEYRLRSLKSYFASYTFNDYVVFLEQCKEIEGVYSANREWFQIRASITQVLLTLSETNPTLFLRVFSHILRSGNPLGLSDWSIVNQVIATYRNDLAAYKLLKRHDYLYKDSYLFAFLSLIGQKKATKYYLSELYEFYQSADLAQIPNSFDYLEAYESLDKSIVAYAVETVYNRARANNVRASLSSLFDSLSKTSQRLLEIFRNNVSLLETVYLDQLADTGTDYYSQSFSQILSIDPTFIYRYIDWMYQSHEYLSHHDDQRNYNFLWLMDNYEAVMSGVLEYIFQKERDILTLESYLETFLIRHSEKIDKVAEERKLKILSQYIKTFHGDRERMKFVFGAVARVFSHKEKELLAVFLKSNKNYEDFDTLPLESGSWAGTGSFVPAFESKIRFLESLLSVLPKDIAMLQHRLRIEEMISRWKKDIEEESRRNFLEASI